MKLTIFERANLVNILPREGDFTNMKVVRTLRESLVLSQEENKLYQPTVSEEGRMTWRVADDEGKPIPQEAEIEIGEMATDIIKKTLKKLNDEKVLKEEYLTLYEKFIGD